MGFECTIVNLPTYRQFTNAAWDWIIKKKKKTKTKQNKSQKYVHTYIKTTLSLGYPSSYFNNKRCNMLLQWLYLSFSWLYNVAAFCQCQCHSSCLRTWSIHRRDREGSSWRNVQISHICNFYSFLWSSSDIFLFLGTALLLRLDSKPTVNSWTFWHLDWIRKRRSGR